MTVGYVYVLKSRQAPIYKIGKAAEHRIEQRLRELDVGTKNELIGKWRVSGYSESEKDLHRILKEYRIPQSEYFALPDHELRRLVDILDDCEFKGYEIEKEDTGEYCYLKITPHSSHLVLEDTDTEVVAIDYRILGMVIDKLDIININYNLSCFDPIEIQNKPLQKDI